MEITNVKTKFLIMSDTHGEDIPQASHIAFDVAIHCGDITVESKMGEFRNALEQLQRIQAPLKIIIPGNHDFTMDVPTFRNHLAPIIDHLDQALVKSEYGDYGEARQIFDDMKAEGIHLLFEGTHRFELSNGALLSVYASPFTPSPHGSWDFHYQTQQHQFDIPKGVDVVVTHTPPRGILDYTCERERAGCRNLFGAVARAQPKLHCFGHIHAGWGAKLATWRPHISETPSHFADIDNGKSAIIETRTGLINTKSDTITSAQIKSDRRNFLKDQGYVATSHGADDEHPLREGQTLFVNAAVQGITSELPTHPAWVVDIDLPRRP
ncbi:Metallo-dependent phosphatase-like protein [Hypoxylon sp. FL1284]|nr:Metallo-dependent phosphatase-like protein [Hypoxylon sp. FL1284]